MLLAVRLLVPVVLAATLVTGCSGSEDGCAGQAYHASTDQQGATTPIQALEVWLGDPVGFDQAPPDEGWTVQQAADDAPSVVLTNEDGNGWWVQAIRTSDGGYVVDQATADASGCQDELS